MSSLSDFELEFYNNGVALVAGVDEVGRGPLAGPVVAGALIPDLSHVLQDINDSKKLTDKKRRELYPLIMANAIAAKTIAISNKKVDEINILEATKLAMREAIASLFPVPHLVLIDAISLTGTGLPIKAIIHGDTLSYAIAAASIIAKVDRDNMMLEYAELYPQYGFEQHKGYGTKHHIEMLKKYGPCPIHRATFIKNFFGEK